MVQYRKVKHKWQRDNAITATGTHIPYGITQCNYFPPGGGDIPVFTPAEAVLDLATPEGCKAELTQVVG